MAPCHFEKVKWSWNRFSLNFKVPNLFLIIVQLVGQHRIRKWNFRGKPNHLLFQKCSQSNFPGKMFQISNKTIGTSLKEIVGAILENEESGDSGGCSASTRTALDIILSEVPNLSAVFAFEFWVNIYTGSTHRLISKTLRGPKSRKNLQHYITIT